jgi:phage terminase large subunit-like protein
MSLSPPSIVERISELPKAERDALILSLSAEKALALRYDWPSWARSNQLPPPGSWSYWMVKAGRGFGKTRTGSETLRQRIKDGVKQANIIVRTVGDIEKVLVRSSGGILKVCPPDERPTWVANKRLFLWPGGATSFVFTAEEPDSLRGPECEFLWADELASWRYGQETWDNAMMGLRLGANPQAIITTTPRPTKLVRELIANPFTVLTAGTTYENRANLAEAFYTQIIRKYEGTRLGRQELLAEVLDDNPGALFKQTDIDGARVTKLPPLVRIVVAMDPAVTSSEESDEWGIIAAGQDGRDPAHFYLLADESAIYTPDEAAKQAVRLYHRLAADRLVGEANNGGDMIEALVRHQDANVAYKKVTASRGKQVRAEPVSALYEQGRVHHHGIFAQLEDQATSWNPKTDKDSPDRMDGMVWAITELAEGSSGWAGFVKEEGEKAAAGQGQPAARVNVEGGNRDKCECGSVIWKDEKCWKCGRPRPQI